MPALRTYRIFISHCWEYADWYHTLVRWLNTHPNFEWRDLSVPESRALREDAAFEATLRRRLGNADVLLVIIGMEIAHRRWMKWEIQWARIRGVPIVGIMPNGGQRIPAAVAASKCPVVGWRRQSVVDAIRHYAR